MNPSRDEIEREKSRIRLQRAIEQIAPYLQEVHRRALEEIEAEEREGAESSDAMTSEQAIRRMLEEACSRVRDSGDPRTLR